MKIGAKDDFENQYMARFRQLAAPHGIFIEYQTDRAGLDIGLHFTQPAESGGKIVVPSLVWFQMKGIMASTLSFKDYKAAREVGAVLEVKHLRFWYLLPQATYLAVYIGCVAEFLVIDIKEWIHENYGRDILTLDQKTVTVSVRKGNELNDDFFRVAMERNLVPALRTALTHETDAAIARFLRDSAVVKWLAISKADGSECRIVVVQYMSKMRTEVYFEGRRDDEDWEGIRNHWQYALSDMAAAFPYVAFKPKRKAVSYKRVEIGEIDGEEQEFAVEDIDFAADEDRDWFSDPDDLDRECLLDLGDGDYSYGDMAGGERITHEIAIELNDVGGRWAATLEALEEAEIISVSMQPSWISVAPWHARDI